MNLTDFGLLVRNLRINSVDELGNYWTRESLSKAISISPDKLGRLERGELKHLDKKTLMLLANAFKLTSLEKKEFFYAALGISNKDLYNNNNTDNQMSILLNEMAKLQSPALLIDSYTDIIAANDSIMNLYMITPELLDYARKLPGGLNLLNMIYTSSFGTKELFGTFWREMTIIEILLFRRSTLRYRHTTYFQYLMNILNNKKQFNIDWYFSQRYADHYDLVYVHFQYEHAHYGPLAYLATESVINTQNGDLYLLIYSPTDSVTLQVFKSIKGKNEDLIYRGASWPEKKMPPQAS